MEIDIARDFGLNINKRKNVEWTQDFVPLKQIIDGVMITEDDAGKKHYVKILEIVAINFSIMSPEEQDRVILNYARSLRNAPSHFQIKIVTKESSVDSYIQAAKESLQTEENESCKKMIRNYINYLSTDAQSQTLKKHYYYIYEYEPPMFGEPAKNENEAIKEVNEKASEIKAGFKACGNKVIIREPSIERQEIAEMLYNYYNPRSSYSEKFQDRVKRIMRDTAIVNHIQDSEQLPETDIETLIAPRSIDFNESPEYMVIDGLYRSHFFVPGRSLPTEINTDFGWFPELLNLGYGFDVDVFFKKVDTNQKLNSIRTNIKITKNDLHNSDEDQDNADDLIEKYSGARYLKQAIRTGHEEVYEMSILLTVQSLDRKNLNAMRKYLKTRANAMDLELNECKRFQEDAFKSTGYFLDLRPKLYNLTHRNLTTSGVAAAYPFTAFELSDKTGIALGTHRENKSMVMFDPFATHYTNANMALYGKSGQGKTFALLTITERLRMQNIQNFILAPDKQDEFRRTCDALGGEFIDIAPTSPQRINLFDIRPMTSPETSFLGGANYVEKSWLIDKVDNIKTWCNYLIPDISLSEKTIIENKLMKLYSEFGITADNDSIYEYSKLKEMPIMSDFYEKVEESVKEGDLRKDILIILSQFISGAAQSMNGHTNVDLDNKYIVFGLEHLKGDLLAPSMFIALEYIWAKSRQDRTKKKMITADEGWKLLDPKNPQVGEFIQEIFKVIRGFGGGAIFATQAVSDLFRDHSNFGNAILSCSHSKVVLGMEPSDLKAISSELALSGEEISTILGSDPGDALFCAGPNHIPIKFEASDMEYNLFTTKRADLESMYNAHVQQ